MPDTFPLGPEIVDETTRKIRVVRDRMREPQDRHKNYADRRRKYMEFELEAFHNVFHNVFHVSQLQKCLTDRDIVEPEIPTDLCKNLTLGLRPVRIVEMIEKSSRIKTIHMVKVIWECNGREETTWETEAKMRVDFPKWFDQFLDKETFDSDSRTNPIQVGETCHTPRPE
ncbi:hypothetical protein N665_0840s0004 [Sinapis alba]|nr:hypothetical protein N665_0840s0004 [Sinapis alba]